MFSTLPQAPINFFQMLDGVLWRSFTYKTTESGFQEIASQLNTWQPYTHRSGDLVDPNQADLPLKGGLILQLIKQNETDGTLKTEQTNYIPEGFTAPTTGQAFTKSINYVDGNAESIELIETSTYAYQVYSSFRSLHNYTATVQKRTTHNELLTAATADTFALSINNNAVTVPFKSASFKFATGDFQPFPFSSYDSLNPATWNGWLRTNLIAASQPNGLVLNSQDASGVNHSILYDKDFKFSVGSVSNAYFEAPSTANIFHLSNNLSSQAAYTGFEGYEDMNGWILANGALVDLANDDMVSDCHTGDQSLRLPNMGQLIRSITVKGNPQTYLVGFWYKTSADYSEGGLQVSITPSLSTTPDNLRFSNTSGDWVYQSIAVMLNDDTNELSICWQNNASSEVRIDDVFIMPMSAELGTHIYDSKFNYVTATNESSGRTSRMLRNRFHQFTSNISFNDQVTDLSVSFCSRQQDNDFNQDTPNAKITLKAATSGVFANFKSGGSYAQNFEFSLLQSHWQVQGDSILHNIAENDTITTPPVEPTQSLAFYLEISSCNQTQINQPFNITVGDYQFTWTPAAKQWSGSGPTSISTVVQKNTPRNILLMRGHGVVVLFADGLFIGSYTESVSGDRIVFSTGNNQMAISNLMILTNPRLKLDYYDASSKVIQTQLLMGQDSYVSQAIHDDVGRDNVVFKAIPFSFQNTHGPNNSAQQVLSYRKGLFNVQEFVTSLQGSGVLNGDIADFYTGNSTKVQQWQTLVSSWNNPTNYSFIPTNDSGYPYSRKRYEASPLARVVEKGQPGTLNDGSLLGIDLTQNATDRKTLQYEFGLNDSEFVLPDLFARNASSYSIISELSPLKSRKVQLKDQQDNLVSTLIYDANTINPRQYNQQFQNYTDSGYSQIIRTPNYFSSDSNRQSTNFQTLLNYDLLGQVSSSHEADTGNTLYMYDSLGRLRFELPDQTSQTNSFIKYTCYNQLSQVVRNGTLDASTFPWSSLALHVDDQSWPSAENSKETRRLSYNDYGTQDSGPSASQLGQVTQVITNNYRTINADSIIIEVKEQFDYDLSAAIVATTQIITEINATSQTIIGSESGYMVEYSYNNLQQLSSISYPSEYGQNLKYSYDELGREKNQQYGDNNGILADYQYGTGDHPSNMSVSVKQEQSIIKQISSVNYNYISPDLLASGSNQNNQNIGTNVGEYEYNANSNIKSETIIFELLKASDMQNYSYQLNKDLNYDESVNRLISSVDSSNPDTNVTDVSYDNNGNIQNLNQANSRINWEFKDNNIIGQRSDLLSAISTSTIEILNNDSGQMLQAPNNAQTSTANTISYDESLGVVASIDIGSSSQVTYAYGSQGQRVLKRSDANSQATRVIYVSPGSHNLSEITIGAENQLLNYIYGQANSLIGVTVGTDIRFPISDQKGTVLAWLNSDSQVLSAYKFLPFGELIVKDDSSSSNPIIYAGQPYEEDIGLYNFRGRFYDPVLRRFISPDPQRQFPSPFVYAGNNPIVNIDPSGEMSKDAIGGLILSIAEIGLAIGTGSFWAIPIGVAGLTNTISHKNDSGKAFWKNYAYSEVGTAIGIAEITAGVALTVLTDGAAGSWGGATLIGAGVSAISYSTFHEGDFSWNAYAKAQVVGAVGGFITGGFGAAAGALTLTGGTLVAAEIGLGITAGVTSSLSSSLISAAWDHQSINWKSALINAGISGALGVAGVGAGRLAKGAFGKVANDIEAEVNPIANERTALNPPDKVTGWKKFVYGENETVFNRNSAGNIIPNPARITNLAKPIVFNSKKPVISAVNDYDPNSKEWV
jgi:RHS repeat-associated protein